jgi:2-polyprenyl-3-methyl-5-hydroxy-6-metoxy-1,4-benzoquinol methylase
MRFETAGINQIVEIFAEHGGTEERYLRDHFPRFVTTKNRFLMHSTAQDGGSVLDVGAHWLHQALLYARDGFEVTALDLPATLDLPAVQSLAAAHGIRLLPNSDLEYPAALRDVADNTFDVVLFTEILEHLAFNPVSMWREIYRVMKPGARIVVTTPNYYALRARIRQGLRAMRLLGGGLAIEQVLSLKTLGHHWKEYSRRELLAYFRMLSPDFRCVNFAYTQEYVAAILNRPGGRLALSLEYAIPPLRPDLYLEVELPCKEKGIIIEPHW